MEAVLSDNGAKPMDIKDGQLAEKTADDKGKKSKRRSKSKSRSRSRSKERVNRRRRSRSRSRSRGFKSPEYRRRRFDDRDPRTRGRYSRERQRSPPSRRSRDRSRDRGGRRRSRSTSNDRFGGRRNRSNWKKGPVSPELPPPPMSGQNNFGMAQQQMYDPNIYNQNYQANQMGYMTTNQQQYGNYDYSMMQQPPPFTAYPPPPQTVIQPIMPPGEEFQQANWTVPPPANTTTQQPSQPIIDEEKQRREAAVAQEKKNQRETLRKQHDDYMRRAAALKRELVILKEQKEDLYSGNEPPSPTTSSFLKENDRLQAQILNKIKTIENVTDMLRGIIGNDKTPSPPPPPPKPTSPKAIVPLDSSDAVNKSAGKKSKRKDTESDDSSPERLKNKVMESLKRNKGLDDRKQKPSIKNDAEESKPQVDRNNYNFFDPEMYWCKTCTVFPQTAKEFLTHLHSKEHADKEIQADTPWHDDLIDDQLPTYSNAPTKRVPIRGIQFFAPVTGWYCKLCSIWMGDLHCASMHLKSKTHTTKMANFTTKNPQYETDWKELRQKAYDKQQLDNPPPPPNISGPLIDNRPFIEGIPLQINQKPKIEPVQEEVKKKKKEKKKREKKKRRKSKKKRHSTSSSSSSSSSASSESEEESPPSPPPPPVETFEKFEKAASIRVAMRNVAKNIVPQPEVQVVEEDTGGRWTVVQDTPSQVPVPMPPTISANGEANKRKDELLLSQWNVPEPIITEKEKKLLEQLKGKLKNREDEKVEKKDERPVTNKLDDRGRRRSPSPNRGRDRDRDRKRRSSRSPRRSHSRRLSRSPKRSPRRSRSPRRRRSRSRSRSRGRRIEKPVVRYPEFRPRVPDKEDKDKNRKGSLKTKDEKSLDKSSSPAPKKSTAAGVTKRLPFIGRMPVFKKQSTEDDKKEDMNPQLELEKRQERERKQDEFKFHVHQKQLMVQQQQKHAEQYVMMHAGQFVNTYNNMNSMQIPIIPTVDEYDDLMPDPMQYVSLMGAPPPPPIEPTIAPKDETPVLPPGIDEEEAESIADAAGKGGLPKDFQDALSIIFDKGAEVPKTEEPEEPSPQPNDIGIADPAYVQAYQSMLDSENHQHVMIDPSQISAAVELDEHTQYAIYGSMTDQPLVFNEMPTMTLQPVSAIATAPTPPPLIKAKKSVNASDVPAALTLPENIPTPPIQILDANGKLMKIPTSNVDMADYPMSDGEDDTSASDKLKPSSRMMELDDLAMLGIDADDLAAQCI